MHIITGNIQKGLGLGKEIGFPTLNFSYKGDLRGVFAGKIIYNDKEFFVAVHLGNKPTLNNENSVCEIYFLNWNDELEKEFSVGKKITVHLIKKIREIKKFESLLTLKKQIKKDISNIRNILK